MTDFNATTLKQQAFGTPKATASTGMVEDLTGTDDMLDLAPPATPRVAKKATPRKSGKRNPTSKPTTKRGALPQPAQTIEDAIAARLPPKDLDALLKEWGQYNLQQATIKAKAETDALAKSVHERRRHIADELLKYADGYGISMAEARKIFDEALAAKRSGKLK